MVGPAQATTSAARIASERARDAPAERIYRNGVLPSGGPIVATSRGDAVSGAAFACAACHQRSGLGGVEGRLAVPPIHAGALFQPARALYHGVEVTHAPPTRPAYDDATLLRAIRDGIGATGRALDPAMPRYALSDADGARLVAYLHTLSAETSPAAQGGTIHLATVVTSEVPAKDRDAMLYVLEKLVAQKNGQAQDYVDGFDNRTARMLPTMGGTRELGAAHFSLAVWTLDGPPETWTAQLETRYAEKRPFALVAGISTRDWRPVHEFSEKKALPTILPITRLPVVSGEGFYTLYASRGLFEEGQAAARWLAGLDVARRPLRVLEIVRGAPEGRALAAGFDAALREVAPEIPIQAFGVEAGAPIPVGDVRGALGQGPAAVMLWDDTAAGLEALGAVSREDVIGVVASGLLGETRLPESLRATTYLTWPKRLPETERRYETVLLPWIRDPAARARPRTYEVASLTFAAADLVSRSLMDMRNRYYEDYLLEAIGMMRNLEYPTLERGSFGPGQRFVTKGAYVVQETGDAVGGGSGPGVVARSGWITH